MGFIVIVAFVVFIVWCYRNRSPSRPDYTPPAPPSPKKQRYINSMDMQTMIEAVDDILNTEFPLYYIKSTIREKIYSALETTQMYDAANFHHFCMNTNTRYWALVQISSHAFDMIATGHYNVQGTSTLTLEGTHLKEIYIWCLNRAYALEYIDKETRDQQIQTLYEQIEEGAKLS